MKYWGLYVHNGIQSFIDVVIYDYSQLPYLSKNPSQLPYPISNNWSTLWTFDERHAIMKGIYLYVSSLISRILSALSYESGAIPSSTNQTCLPDIQVQFSSKINWFSCFYVNYFQSHGGWWFMMKGRAVKIQGILLVRATST